ncbi:hypothetical protein SRHO_G00139570 [Serrasalmus rhombeus]
MDPHRAETRALAAACFYSQNRDAATPKAKAHRRENLRSSTEDTERKPSITAKLGLTADQCLTAPSLTVIDRQTDRKEKKGLY